MPSLHCCAALCAGLPQAVSYRCCSRSLQEVTLCSHHWKKRCMYSYNRENKSLAAFFYWLAIHQQVISSCQAVMTAAPHFTQGMGMVKAVTHVQLR